MGFTDEVRQALLDRIGPDRRFANNKRMADELEVDPSQLNRFLKKERGLNADSLGHILDRLGAALVFPDSTPGATREVMFTAPDTAGTSLSASNPSPADYLAVPLTRARIAACPGLIPDSDILGWILVWKAHIALNNRTNLVAVRIGEQDAGMSPTLHPGDLALVDRDDRDASKSGRLMLVREPGPEGAALLRRVRTKSIDHDRELIFYADDNRACPPDTYSLERDYGGDAARAIAGAVVRTWCDVTRT